MSHSRIASFIVISALSMLALPGCVGDTTDTEDGVQELGEAPAGQQLGKEIAATGAPAPMEKGAIENTGPLQLQQLAPQGGTPTGAEIPQTALPASAGKPGAFQPAELEEAGPEQAVQGQTDLESGGGEENVSETSQALEQYPFWGYGGGCGGCGAYGLGYGAYGFGYGAYGFGYGGCGGGCGGCGGGCGGCGFGW